MSDTESQDQRQFTAAVLKLWEWHCEHNPGRTDTEILDGMVVIGFDRQAVVEALERCGKELDL